MMEIYQNFGNDLVLTADGDLQRVSGTDLLNQRVIRRLLTNPGTYIWNPTYGGGVPRFIGQIMTDEVLSSIQAVITEQMYMEEAVSQSPPPEIELVVSMYNRLNGNITYQENISNSQSVIVFSITESGVEFASY